MELSELTVYDGRLLSFCDRTGIIFEFIPGGKDKEGAPTTTAVPRFVISEGAGDSDKGMKWEWATVKDGLLYLGSFGKEFTNQAGEIVNRNNMWIVVIDHSGSISRVNWTENYNKVRSFVGVEAPGYLVHEAVLWSPHMKRWLFLPRRLSKIAYDDVEDEKRGANVLITADAKFENMKKVEIQLGAGAMMDDGLHGFSTFALIPGTQDRHALAIRSVEENCTSDDDDVCHQRSYVLVFDTLTGDVLLEETLMDNTMKFEGVEFVQL